MMMSRRTQAGAQVFFLLTSHHISNANLGYANRRTAEAILLISRTRLSTPTNIIRFLFAYFFFSASINNTNLVSVTHLHCFDLTI